MNRRTFLGAGAAAIALRRGAFAKYAARPTPTPAQLAWQRDELALFCHFGVNTFTDREWGDGKEDSAVFNPTRLDARQWARAAKAAGARAMILTAKHHDGFCLWPTRTTQHSVATSPFRGGSGDVVREFVDACRAESLRPGLYLSPWDRNASVYGDSPRYNDFYVEQLTELLTRYGDIAEVWFDGANGEGPNGKKQTYDWPRIWGTVRTLQPNAVIFSDAGPDVRWIGNERGVAGDTNWSTVDPAVVPFPGADGPDVIRMLQHGDPNGSVWRPGETDVSIRPGWFHHVAEDAKVKSPATLVDLYFTSVGRNSKLLLNVPPNRDGLFADADVANLAATRRTLDALFARELTRDSAGTISTIDLREDIRAGQFVQRYAVEGMIGGEWRELAAGTTIGHRRLHRIAPTPVDRTRLRILETFDTSRPVELRLY